MTHREQDGPALVREAFHVFGQDAARQLGNALGLGDEVIIAACGGSDRTPSNDNTRPAHLQG